MQSSCSTPTESNPMPVRTHIVCVPGSTPALRGCLEIPLEPQGLVLLAQCRSGSWQTPRDRRLADALQEAGLATFQYDLLTVEEEERDRFDRRFRLNISLLTERIVNALAWLQNNEATRELRVGLLGSGTAAAAAFLAAAERPDVVHAIVSKSGRPDMAGQVLGRVWAPTLLIAGGNDPAAVRVNLESLSLLRVERKLEIVTNASHLFVEAGALDRVMRMAREWFERHLVHAFTHCPPILKSS